MSTFNAIVWSLELERSIWHALWVISLLYCVLASNRPTELVLGPQHPHDMKLQKSCLIIFVHYYSHMATSRQSEPKRRSSRPEVSTQYYKVSSMSYESP